jgi:hypothetical protein
MSSEPGFADIAYTDTYRGTYGLWRDSQGFYFRSGTALDLACGSSRAARAISPSTTR